MARANRYGLSREIPALVKRTVRQECGFGCVLCGNAIYQYEHIEDFARVREHASRDIALLCGSCHEKVTRGFISKSAVREHRIRPKRHRWPRSSFLPNGSEFPIALGGAEFIKPRTVLRVFGRDILTLREPEFYGEPFRLSGEFYDKDGRLCFRIQDNEFEGDPSAWDIETRGSRVTIRRSARDVALRVRLAADRVVVERLKMCYEGVFIVANERMLRIVGDCGRSYCLSGRLERPDTGLDIQRTRGGVGADVAEIVSRQPDKRVINLLGTGGDYVIGGTQPKGSKINFFGPARNLTVDGDVEVTVGGRPPTPSLGLALAEQFALSLSLGSLDVRIGAGVRSGTLAIL